MSIGRGYVTLTLTLAVWSQGRPPIRGGGGENLDPWHPHPGNLELELASEVRTTALLTIKM